MSIPRRSLLAHKQIDDLGETAVLTEYTESTQDSYGDETYTETTTNLKVVKSTSTNTRLPFIRDGELGHYYMMQIEFFCKDVDEDGNTFDPPNLAVDKPPTLVHEGLTYEIMEFEDSKIGLVRMLGYRERL